MARRVLALVAALSLLATGCGPDEREGDLSRFAATVVSSARSAFDGYESAVDLGRREQ